MKLFQTVRKVDVLNKGLIVSQGAYNKNVLNVGVTSGTGGSQPEPASILFRSVALTALTFRENANNLRPLNTTNPNGPITIDESQKVFTINDCLVIFGKAYETVDPPTNLPPFETFPRLIIQDIDLSIANNELNVVDNLGVVINKTSNDYRNCLIIANPNDRIGWPNDVKNWVAPTFNRDNIFKNYTIAAGKAATAKAIMGVNIVDGTPTAFTLETFQDNTLTFFDEVNIIHNCHKDIGISFVTNVPEPEILRLPKEAGLSFAESLIYITVQKSGNLEGVKIDTLGYYPPRGTDNTQVDIINLQNFKNYFVNNIIPPVKNIPISKNNPTPTRKGGINQLSSLRDLFRLECIREPAALITTPIYHELASQNNCLGYETIVNTKNDSFTPLVYSFKITGIKMPMGPKEIVDESRKLRIAINNVYKNLYYKYDFATVKRGGKDLANLENDLLFHYIIYLSGLKNNIRNILYDDNNKLNLLNTQRLRLLETGWIHNNDGENDYYTIGVVDVNGNNYEFLIDIVSMDPDTKKEGDEYKISGYDITINSFSLNIINTLVSQWYGINLELPNVQITNQISLVYYKSHL